jgi:hypothetical protein
LDSFGFEIELSNVSGGGQFLQLHQVMGGTINDDGSVSFLLVTDEGRFTVESEDPVFTDSGAHTVSVTFDGETLALAIDGLTVDETEASGTTPEAAYHGIVLGNAFGNGVDATVNNFQLQSDPAGTFSGDDSDADAPVELPQAAETPPIQLVKDEIEEVEEIEAPQVPVVEAPQAPVTEAPQAPVTPTAPIEGDLVSLNFASGNIADTSDFATGITTFGNGAHAGGFDIGGRDRIEIDRFAQQTHELDSFGFEIELSNVSGGGQFLQLHQVMGGTINDDGSVSFLLVTDEGRFTVESDFPVFTDSDAHTIGVTYDGETLALAIDGVTVEDTEASGTTPEAAYHGIVLGNAFGRGVDATVNNFQLQSDPAEIADNRQGAPAPAEPDVEPVTPLLPEPEQDAAPADAPAADLDDEPYDFNETTPIVAEVQAELEADLSAMLIEGQGEALLLNDIIPDVPMPEEDPDSDFGDGSGSTLSNSDIYILF